MEILLLAGLLLAMSVTLTGAQFQLFQRAGTYPNLSDFNSFKIYVKGRHQSFNSDDGLETDSIDRSFLNGGPRFIIKENEQVGKASITGNLGTRFC